MDWNKTYFFRSCIYAVLSCLILLSCSVSYKFNGASVDYNLVKTMTIDLFPNQAEVVYPSLSQTFTDGLKNKFITQTRLRMQPNNGDLHLEGEITSYQLTQSAVKDDGFSSQNRLTISVKLRYTNNKKPTDDLDQSFSGYREFPSTELLESVQDRLIREIVEDLADEIYNATLGNW
ncbi:hypothetical protein AwDysgo_04530 [Bacteroidales bacterium]|nr:hypothetical protein AwDysgo_04530 [Bacteroidales bacterium]